MVKSQTIRLLDVALVGPAMIVGSYELRRRSVWLAAVLGALGIGTMLYNGINYCRYAHQQRGGLI